MQEVPASDNKGPPGYVVALGAGLRAWFAKVPPEPMPEHWANMLRRIESEQPLSVPGHGSDVGRSN